jgi:uncharacterized protein
MLLLAALLVLSVAAGGVRAEVAVPPLTARVIDLTGTLAPTERDQLEAKLAALEQRKGSQLAVLLVPTTAPEAIEQYGIRVADAWRLGRKGVDDGLLLLVAKDDRAVRVEVGYGLEGPIPDATANRVIDEFILPRFRQGDYAGGIGAGVDRLIGLVDGEPLPAPEPAAAPDVGLGNILPIIFVVSLVAGGILRSLLGQLPGAAATGLLAGVVTWLLSGIIGLCLFMAVVGFMVGLAPAGRGGRWASRGPGGFGGGMGGGGFGGGGGGFGGGGASGRW